LLQIIRLLLRDNVAEASKNDAVMQNNASELPACLLQSPERAAGVPAKTTEVPTNVAGIPANGLRALQQRFRGAGMKSRPPGKPISVPERRN
jgi:hypothetical protein